MPESQVIIPASGVGTATPPVATDLDVNSKHVQHMREVVPFAKRTHATSATISAGGQATLDSDQISSGKTGHLLHVSASSSVPIKVEVRTVSNGVASANLIVGGFRHDAQIPVPTRGFVSVAQDATAGFDGFRVVITNLDTSEAADVYATFFYEEV